MAAIQQQGMANQSKPPSLRKRKSGKFQVLSESDKMLFQRQARMLRPNDIVCGRAFSKLCKNWKRSGWKTFHRLIEQNSSDYCNAQKKGKQAVAEKLWKLLREDHIRFVRFTSGNGFEELSEKDAIEKIKQVSLAVTNFVY